MKPTKLQELKELFKDQKKGTYIFLMVWIAYIIIALLKNIHYDVIGLYYQDWGISDWLINYQDGFVRRGLPGEVIYLLFSIHPFNILYFILSITVISSVLLLIVMIKVFRKKGWSFAILPLGCCFFFTFLSTWQRKDSLLLLLTYCIFLTYKQFLEKGTFRIWLLFFVLSAVMILSHEASFFFSIPLLMAYTFFNYGEKWQKDNMKEIVKMFLAFVPILLVMLAVCIFKGNTQVADVIWHSWDRAFSLYPDSGHTYEEIAGKAGASVSALSWKFLPTAVNHLSTNLFGTFPIEHIWATLFGLPGLIWMFCAYYYLVTRLNTVKVGRYPMARHTEREISNTLIVQFVCMSPMFTFLSCDYGRTIPYWVMSTLMAVACFGKLRMKFVDRLTVKFQAVLSCEIMGSSFFYTLVVLCTPLVLLCAPIPDNVLQVYYLRKAAHALLQIQLF